VSRGGLLFRTILRRLFLLLLFRPFVILVEIATNGQGSNQQALFPRVIESILIRAMMQRTFVLCYPRLSSLHGRLLRGKPLLETRRVTTLVTQSINRNRFIIFIFVCCAEVSDQRSAFILCSFPPSSGGCCVDAKSEACQDRPKQ
jgi:hypothetical protein